MVNTNVEVRDFSIIVLVPIVNFSANFHLELINSTYPEKISQIRNIIQSWETDFKTFIAFVEEAFLEC